MQVSLLIESAYKIVYKMIENCGLNIVEVVLLHKWSLRQVSL